MALRSSSYAPRITLDTKELEGFEHKLKHLHGLSVKKRRQKMQQVVKFALKETKKQMKANAGKIRYRGVLKESIDTVNAKAVGYGSRVGARTGPKIRGSKKKRAFHAHLVELGTKKKHKTVKPGKKKFTFYSRKSSKWVFTKGIHHGSKAQPYIEPAWQKTKKGIPARISLKITRILANLTKKMQ
jgi:hypothetical protein